MFDIERRMRRGPLGRVAGSAVAVVAILLAGCGGGDGASGSEAARAPSRAGAVWEVDSATSRAAAPAVLLAYVNGLHVVVVDGGDIYTGMTRRKAASTPDGGWELQLGNGLTAELRPDGDAMQLAFSSGEKIGMHKRADKEGDR